MQVFDIMILINIFASFMMLGFYTAEIISKKDAISANNRRRV